MTARAATHQAGTLRDSSVKDGCLSFLHFIICTRASVPIFTDPLLKRHRLSHFTQVDLWWVLISGSPMCLFLQSAFQCIIIDKTINIESVWAEEAGKRLPETQRNQSCSRDDYFCICYYYIVYSLYIVRRWLRQGLQLLHHHHDYYISRGSTLPFSRP